jgi:hypothetical protein
MEDMYHIQVEDKHLDQDWLEIYTAEIPDTRYQWTDAANVVTKQHHLTATQKAELLVVL